MATQVVLLRHEEGKIASYQRCKSLSEFYARIFKCLRGEHSPLDRIKLLEDSVMVLFAMTVESCVFRDAAIVPFFSIFNILGADEIWFYISQPLQHPRLVIYGLEGETGGSVESHTGAAAYEKWSLLERAIKTFKRGSQRT